MITLNELADNTEFDVAIVGAGMVGASAALGFAGLGRRVLLIEAFSLNSASMDYTPSYDARSTALSWGTKEIFETMALWADISKHVCAIDTVHVSQKGRFGITRMSADEMNKDALGYVVPNQWLGTVLLNHVAEHSNITLCSPAKVSKLSNDEAGNWQLLLSAGEDNKTARSELVVIADGSDSKTAALLGIESDIESYGQHAIIANVSTELPNQGVAYERFTSDGPIALLPLDEATSALVWTHDSDKVNEALELDETQFCQRLEAQIGSRLGRITKCGERHSYPLRLIQAKEQRRSGLILLGNAAHSLHPVAGQGFNLALRGVVMLIDALVAGKNTNAALKHYYEVQKGDQQRTILMSDQLVKLFGQSSHLMGIARDVGLIGLNNVPLFKQTFANVAMGIAGRKASMKVVDV